MSPRPRKGGSRQLPAHVYRNKGRYFYRDPKSGAEKRLAAADAPMRDVWQAYLNLTGEESHVGTLEWLAQQYFVSDAFTRLATRSQTQARRAFERLADIQSKAGKRFGALPLVSITPGLLTRLMDSRSASPIAANRDLALLSVMFRYGAARDLVPENPCRLVRRYPERPRTRYVTDEEYKAVYTLASPAFKASMEIAYLCRARLSEVLHLKRSALVQDGILLERTKRSRTQIIGWTPRLRAAVEWSKDRKVTSLYVIHSARGHRYTTDGFGSTWQRLMRTADVERFTFHDLKAKGVSDFEGDRFKASGHRSPQMIAVYDRRIEVVAATR